MRIVFIGAVKFSHAALSHVLSLGGEVVGVVSRPADGAHSDYCDLAEVCDAHQVPLHLSAQVNAPETIRWIAGREPDVVFCFGWSQLIKQPLLGLAPLGVVGYHPTMLPANRGRHPLIWALVLGLTETGSTFFFMDENADTGDILSQRPVSIARREDAATLYAKVTAAALEQISEFLPLLRSGDHQRVPQSEGGNAWRRRTRLDGRIDWRMSSATIHNLVRGLTHPYPGAEAKLGDDWFPVWQCQAAPAAQQNQEPGRVLKVDGQVVTVKTADAAIALTRHDFPYLPKAGDCL